MRKLTQTEVIAKFKRVHGDKYDYSKVKYTIGTVKVPIVCSLHGEFMQTPASHIRGRGCPLCALEEQKKIIYGHGINDMFYEARTSCGRIWHGVLRRCFDASVKTKHPAYEATTICKEWLKYSNFKKWFNNPENGYREGYHLDKDLISKGNQVYSPDTCCFIPQELNKLLTDRKRRRGDCPIGVHKHNKKYIAAISIEGRSTFLGRFETPILAFNAYKTAKETYIKDLAVKYFSCGAITRRVYDAMLNYKIEITD